MSFWSDPAHIWIAVFASGLTTVISVALFALVVKTMLDQFLTAQREILERSQLQVGSVDTSLSLHSQRITSHDGRISLLEQDRMERDARESAIDARVRRLEGL